MTNQPNELLQEGYPNTRKLRLFSVGASQFGVFETDIAAAADWQAPAPLPHAPAAVMGVVGIQGRMLTLLDLAKLPGIGSDDDHPRNNGNRRILALRGDEQLALAVDALGETIELALEDLQEYSTAQGLVTGVLRHNQTEIRIINVKELFPSAIQGRERRRRRF